MLEPIVSAQWLHDNLENPDLIILNASQNPDIDYKQIKGSRFFDLKSAFSDKESKFPNTIPSPVQFEIECQKLGINDSSRIVVYDNKGVYSSPRVWWLFKVMGHKNVSVLNGGLPEWINQSYKTVEKESLDYKPGDFKTKFQSEMVRDYDFIKSNIKKQEAIVIDARSQGRFEGTAPEPREGLRSGHIPNSLNLPYEKVLDQGKLKSKTELTKIFEDLKISDKPLTFSCGSGITACIILLASELVLTNEKSVYDGSWTEWAQLTI